MVLVWLKVPTAAPAPRRKMVIRDPPRPRLAPARGARCRAGLLVQCLVPCSFRVVPEVEGAEKGFGALGCCAGSVSPLCCCRVDIVFLTQVAEVHSECGVLLIRNRPLRAVHSVEVGEVVGENIKPSAGLLRVLVLPAQIVAAVVLIPPARLRNRASLSLWCHIVSSASAAPRPCAETRRGGGAG